MQPANVVRVRDERIDSRNPGRHDSVAIRLPSPGSADYRQLRERMHGHVPRVPSDECVIAEYSRDVRFGLWGLPQRLSAGHRRRVCVSGKDARHVAGSDEYARGARRRITERRILNITSVIGRRDDRRLSVLTPIEYMSSD